MGFFQELKRRNVFRMAVAYAVSAWLLIEVSSTLEETLRLPEWSDTLLAFILILLFPFVLFFSWAYEITPDGIKREKEIERGESITNQTGRKLDRVIIVMMALALAYFAFDKFMSDEPAMKTPVATKSAEPDSGPSAVLEEVPANLSIAVLPFVNMSSDPEQEYFSDGLTEELLNLLAGIEELKVAARTSSFYYKDKLDSVPLTEVARQLEVAHILEGSVRKGGDQIRVTAQLIKAEDGFHLWSETYDRTLDDIFAIQDEIAAAVVDELKIVLLGEVPHAKVIDTESYELALQGRYLFNRRSEGDLPRALELFERAVELDPDNAAAWVGMTPLLVMLKDPPEVDRAIVAIDNALRLDPDNPEAYVRKALVCYWDQNCDNDGSLFQRALELGPNNPLVLAVIAGNLMYGGHYEEAIEYQRRAVAADPLFVTNVGNLASMLTAVGFYNEAEEYALKALELAPGSPGSIDTLAEIRLLQGRAAEALELANELPEEIPMHDDHAAKSRLLVMTEYSLGNNSESDSAFEQFRQDQADANPVEIAWVYAWRGETELAFEWIQRALALDPEIDARHFLHPFFFSLHADPRWQDVKAHWPEVEKWPEPSLQED